MAKLATDLSGRDVRRPWNGLVSYSTARAVVTWCCVGPSLTPESLFTTISRFVRGALRRIIADAGMMEQEKAAGRSGRLAEKLLRHDFIVIDELGYLPFSQSCGQLLFHLISKLYENKSLLNTDQSGILRIGTSGVRRRQDDNRYARSPHSPLRYRRDRQRELALQEPRITLPLTNRRPPTPALLRYLRLRDRRSRLRHRGRSCAGLPVTSAVHSVGAEAAPPLNKVFELIANQVELGVPFENALDVVSQRIGIPDFRFFSVAVTLQHGTAARTRLSAKLVSPEPGDRGLRDHLLARPAG